MGGLITQLGGDKSDSGDEPESEAADESMLEQHLRAFKRALDGGNFKQAASCFSAAMAEAGESAPADEESPDEEY